MPAGLRKGAQEMTFATVKAFLSKQSASAWMAHISALLLVLAYLGFQGWALYKAQPWDAASFGAGATGLIGAVTALFHFTTKKAGTP
jgi:hypothetical protein